MKFIAMKENLIEGLNTVTKAISNKNTLPILSGILLKAEEGHLMMTAADFDMRIECKIPIQLLEPGETVVPGKYFNDFVRRLPDTNILFTSTSKDGADQLTISYNEATSTINGWPGREFPGLQIDPEKSTFSINCAVFQDMVRHTAFCANIDDIRPVFTGALLEIEGSNLNMIATDSHRLALKSCTIDGQGLESTNFIVPARILTEAARLFAEDEVLSILLTNRQIIFQNDLIKLTAQLIKGDFPDYRRVIPKDYKTFLKTKRSVLKETLERANLFSQEKDGTAVVRCHIGENNLNIKTQSDFGRVDENLPIYMEGEYLDISFNARYLLDAFGKISYEDLDVTFNGPLGAAIFRPMNDNRYTYLLLPLRS